MKRLTKLISLFLFYIFFVDAEISLQKEGVKSLTEEIFSLQKQIKEERLKIFQAEEEAQKLMFFEWSAYIKKIQEIEQYEDNIIRFKKQLKPLIDQKIKEF